MATGERSDPPPGGAQVFVAGGVDAEADGQRQQQKDQGSVQRTTRA